MAKRIYLEDNYLIIAEALDLTDDKRNLLSNVYVEKNGDLFIFYKLHTDAIIDSIRFTDILDGDGVAYLDIDTFTDLMEKKTGKPDSIDVVLQDTTSPLLIVKASNIVADTTLTTLTAKDDVIINVTDATGFVIGQYLTIYNLAANRVYFSNILAINVLAIELDTPLDFEFAVGSAVTVGNTNMAVNGAVTPQIFGIRNPGISDIPLKYDITRLIFTCLAAATVDLSKFGDIIGGLVKGVVVRKVDGEYRNVFNAKTNAELKNLMYDFDIQTVQGAQQDGFTGRLTFAGQSKMGPVIRLSEAEDLHIIIQDDLSTLVSFTMISEGHEVQD